MKKIIILAVLSVLAFYAGQAMASAPAKDCASNTNSVRRHSDTNPQPKVAKQKLPAAGQKRDK